MTINNTDFLIAGGGVIGLNLALEIKKNQPDSSVTLLEKEGELARHASGRNSGVLHAGFYYQPDSLKARFCRDGNLAIREYCKEKQLRLNQCGKLVVCKDESEQTVIDELVKRGKKNDIKLKKLTEYEAHQIDERVCTAGSALWSPSTCSVDPLEVMGSLRKDAEHLGIRILCNTAFINAGNRTDTVLTSRGKLRFGYFINAAGLYADKIARQWGFAEHYRIIPFKGMYLYASLPARSQYIPKTHIYPVPDLKFPFLGVHFTLTVDGLVKIGPTAIPAFWREHYQGLDRFNLVEAGEILFRESQLLLANNFGFRRLALNEFKKYNRKFISREASQLYSKVKALDFQSWGRPGIRAQLIDMKSKTMEMDFVFEGDDRSFHVLNAVSPAFTCSMPFSAYLWQQIDRKINGAT